MKKQELVVFDSFELWSSLYEMHGAEQYEFINDDFNQALHAAKENLGASSFQGAIVALVDVGRWNGRSTGVKYLGWTELDAILLPICTCDDWRVTVAGRDVHASYHHHDGVHYAVLRQLKEWREYEDFKWRYLKAKTEEERRRLVKTWTTGIGKHVRKVYGW